MTAVLATPPGRLLRLLFSGVVVVAVVAAVVMGVPRQNQASVPSGDYLAAVADARRQAPYHLLAPEGLRDGWVVTGVRYDGDVEGAATWHVGLVTPRGRIAGVEQSNGETGRFVNVQTNHGVRSGWADVRGVPWGRWDRTDRGVHSLARVDDEVSTVVMGNAGYHELVELAGSLR